MVVCTALISAVPAAAAPASAGDVRFVKDAGAGFDAVTASPSSSTKAFFLRNYSRMVVHSPYFDSRLRWYPRGWAYLDLYGISDPSRIARQHPSWILRDRAGNQLYIPFACSGGSCVQYAGDPTNPAFRRWWIRRARRIVRRGYKGLYLDNVNLIRRVSYGTGQEVVPRSPRSRRRISGVAWRRAIARFTRQIRRSLRRTEIAHNVIWFAPGAKGKWGRHADPLGQRDHPRARRERRRADRRQRAVRAVATSCASATGSTAAGPASCSTRTRTPRRGATTAWPATSWSTPAATSSRARAPATRPTGGGATRSASGAPRGKRYRWHGLPAPRLPARHGAHERARQPDPQRRPAAHA